MRLGSLGLLRGIHSQLRIDVPLLVSPPALDPFFGGSHAARSAGLHIDLRFEL